MARQRSGTLSTILVAAVAARPALVVVLDTGVLGSCSAEFLAKVGNGNLKISEVLKGNEELCVGGSAVCGECIIGCSKRCN